MSELRTLGANEQIPTSPGYKIDFSPPSEEEQQPGWFDFPIEVIKQLWELPGNYSRVATEFDSDHTLTGAHRGGVSGALWGDKGVAPGVNEKGEFDWWQLIFQMLTGGSSSAQYIGGESPGIPVSTGSTASFIETGRQPLPIYKDETETGTGEENYFLPSQRQLFAAGGDPFFDTGLNLTAGSLHLKRLITGEGQLDPKETPIGKWLESTRELNQKGLGAKNYWEMTAEEKALLNDLPASIFANIYATTILGFTGVPVLQTSSGLVNKAGTWAIAIGLEEALSSAFEGRDKTGSAWDLAQQMGLPNPFAIKPTDNYMEAFIKAATGNAIFVGSLAGVVRTGFETPNIWRHVKENGIKVDINNARTWLDENAIQRFGSSEFLDFNKAIEAGKKLASDFKSGQLVENLSGDQGRQVSPSSTTQPEGATRLEPDDSIKKVEDLEGDIEFKAQEAGLSVDQAIQKVSGATEVDVVVRAIDELEDTRVEKILESEGSVLDQLNKELLDQDEAKQAGIEARNNEFSIDENQTAFVIPESTRLGRATYGGASIEFANKIDHAAWLLRPGRKSYPKVTRTIRELAAKSGIDFDDIRRHGANVHQSIKDQVKEQYGTAQASNSALSGQTISVPDKRFGRVVSTANAPDPVVSFADQYRSMSTNNLLALANPEVNPKLFAEIKTRTGREFSELRRADVIRGLLALREQGVTVRPIDAKFKSATARNNAKVDLVKRAIDQGEVRPSSSTVPEAQELPFKPEDRNTTVRDIAREELLLSRKYDAIDRAKAAGLKEKTRLQEGYYDMPLAEQKDNGLLEGWSRQEAEAVEITDLNRQLESLTDELEGLERLQEERTGRGLGSSEELDEMIARNKSARYEVEAELARIQGDDSFDFSALRSLKEEVKVARYDPAMIRVLQNRQALHQFLADTVRRIGGEDTKFTFFERVQELEKFDAQWGIDKTNAKIGGEYEIFTDHLSIYEVTKGLKPSEIVDRFQVAAHESFHRLQFGYLTLEEMKVFDTIDGGKRFNFYGQLNPNLNTAFKRQKTASIEKMTVGFQEYALARAMGVDPFERAMFNKVGAFLEATFPRVDKLSWVDGKFHHFILKVMSGFDRIFEATRRVGNYMQGRGFNSVDSIYEAAYSGKIAETRRFNSVLDAINKSEIEVQMNQIMDRIARRNQERIKPGLTKKDSTRLTRLNNRDQAKIEALSKNYADGTKKSDILNRWSTDNEKFLKWLEERKTIKQNRITELKSLALNGGC